MKLYSGRSIRRVISLCVVISLSLICALAYSGSTAPVVIPAPSTSTETNQSYSNDYVPYGYVMRPTEEMLTNAPAGLVDQQSTDDLAVTLLLLHHINQADQAAADIKQERAALEAAQLLAKKQALAEAELESLRTETPALRTVVYDETLVATETIQLGSKPLGEVRLSFYCPCALCNGRSDGKTASGTIMQEGRTIAVDSNVIPLGSRVYIEGYGIFIAEDTGSAINGNRIDICVSEHERAYQMGIDYANAYLIV